MILLNLKDFSQYLTENCAISFSFHLYSVLYTYVKNCFFTGRKVFETKHPLTHSPVPSPSCMHAVVYTTIRDACTYIRVVFVGYMYFPASLSVVHDTNPVRQSCDDWRQEKAVPVPVPVHPAAHRLTVAHGHACMQCTSVCSG
jgi:hypothetical protein